MSESTRTILRLLVSIAIVAVLLWLGAKVGIAMWQSQHCAEIGGQSFCQ